MNKETLIGLECILLHSMSLMMEVEALLLLEKSNYLIKEKSIK
jgi:hypothetical protein